MRKLLLKEYLIISVLLGGVIFVGIENLFIHQFQECVTSKTESYGTRESNPKPLIVVFRAIGTQSLCTVRVLDKHNGFFAFVCALAVAAFTGTLWNSTEKLWQASEKQLAIAERALIELERPYLFVKFGAPGFEIRKLEATDPATGDISVEFISRYEGVLKIEFINFGRSPAILTEQLDVYDPTAGQSAMPYAIDPNTQRGKKLPVGIISADGRPYMLAKHAYFAFGQKSLSSGALINDRFFCLGYVRYEDIFGGKYILGYCGYFDYVSERFILEGGEKYNYMRVEADPRTRHQT